MKKLYTTLGLSLLISGTGIFAQQEVTSGKDYRAAIEKKLELNQQSIVKNIPFKNVGPTVMSGRVTDLAVNPEDPTEFYVAYATGGVWHTKNNGTTFQSVTDNAPTLKIGDIAKDWKNGTLWVGTGEVNASRSSYAGIGMMKTEDDGETWEVMGLPDSHHISRILINPENPDEIVVGVTGHLYSDNAERGIFKTTDGGQTWTKKLFINEHTGIIDVAVNPDNYAEMYAAAWDKDRKAWDFKEGGESSGIYKSTDSGDTWELISTKSSGFPTGDGVGRIGISVFDGNTVYAIVDNQNHRPDEDKKEEKPEGLQKKDFDKMSQSKFLKLEDEELEKFLRSNGFQDQYTAESVKEMVRKGSIEPKDLSIYLGKDAMENMLNTPVIGAEVYRSDDAGKTWKRTHDDYLDDLYYSYGYYFGMVHVDPQDKDGIYIYGVPIIKSKDGGKTFKSIDASNVHSDHHTLWIDPNKSGHLINGNDGGVNISYDDGETWIKNNTPAVGQFYSVNVDNEKNYNVYGGLQDNGVWVGPHNYEEGPGWQASGEYGYESIMGGDGMQVEIDSRDADIVYTGFQFGSYFRINRKTGERSYIQPKHSLGEAPYRFNWQSPILLSPHNQDIVYFGTNKLMRSMDQGENWQPISEDLTHGGKEGDVPYGTLASVTESPFQFGLIYTGSDDGYIYRTKDGGGSWTKISDKLPQDLWVSRLVASEHSKERVYATLNGYRWDDFKPYVYVSEDYGTTWKAISSNLPLSPVNVIREDPANEKILYLGTDNGLYVSLDRGASWQAFSANFPNVPVHDLRVQERDKDLVVGTHGRSIYIADISPISDMDLDKMEDALSVSSAKEIRFSPRWGNSYSKWMDPYVPELPISFYTSEAGKATITIQDDKGNELQKFEVDADKGFNTAEYDLTITESGKEQLQKADEKTTISKAANEKFYIPVGKYTMQLQLNGKTAETKFEVTGGRGGNREPEPEAYGEPGETY
ncbi:VPS10 domain-containing protein [Christiangramia flava]|uniref:Glycosyl hydrolase, BNR repeat n=1 Tax=Christiangramia flava JLT2011 TaxID=1229726 RepID=A0A1L7I467_9FLAO|nr:glycosyl hydrolase [Christiangramia flava]APU67953.1 Glycosyl hydrolase, BNR repeat precursor [Christiangramia flava JLT2011]OSS40454.1 Glycosyl hydrolase, BNR repeat precursor [Christiangramia flava JLT2011]